VIALRFPSLNDKSWHARTILALAAAFVLLTSISLSYGASVSTAVPRIVSSTAIFELVDGDWRCAKLLEGKGPELFKDIQAGDVLAAIGPRDLHNASILTLLYTLRRVEFGLETEATLLRSGTSLKITSSVPKSPHDVVVTSQDSPVVLQGNVPGIQAGDKIVAYGDKAWSMFSADFAHGSMPAEMMVLKAGTVIIIQRKGAQSRVVTRDSTFASFLLLPDYSDANLPILDSTVLHGLNVNDRALTSFRGHWTLLHFWASWCAPCIKMTPAVRSLTALNGLQPASIGFSDSPEQLKTYAEKEKIPAAFAPDPALATRLGISGIPYDLLLDPQGEPMLATQGLLSASDFQKLVASYVEGSN